jgi:hypothetical protein
MLFRVVLFVPQPQCQVAMWSNENPEQTIVRAHRYGTSGKDIVDQTGIRKDCGYETIKEYQEIGGRRFCSR